MSLVRYSIGSLEEGIRPLAEGLSEPRGGGFLDREWIIAPSQGMQQWLRDALARRLGASPGKTDGVVANVDLIPPGALLPRLLGASQEMDPWSNGRMGFRLLELLAEDPRRIPTPRRADGLFLAARRMADLFERYHFHRAPMMVRWAKGEAVGAAAEGHPPSPLAEAHLWQFELWRTLRERAEVPSPPERLQEILQQLRSGGRPPRLPSRVAAFGISGLSPLGLDALLALAQVSEVRMWTLHPSPTLQRRLHSLPPASATREASAPPPSLSPFAHRLLQRDDRFRDLANLPQLEASLRPAQALEVALMRAGIPVDPPQRSVQGEDSSPPSPPSTLLARLQSAIRSDEKPPASPPDRSVQIHRAPGPLRQVEVLHELLLHLFKELRDLQPSDVLIAVPDLRSMAPHLRAVFGESAFSLPESAAARSGAESLHLPLTVGDRSPRETNPVVGFLAEFFERAQSRFGIEDFRALAAFEGVQRKFEVESGEVEDWMEWARHVRVRWGITADQRTRFGIPASWEAHSWLHGLHRLVYGAALPRESEETRDAGKRPFGSGGVSPMAGLEPGDLPTLGAFALFLRKLRDVLLETESPKSVVDWCDWTERTLAALYHTPRKEQAEREPVLRLLRRIRDEAAPHPIPIPFEEFRRYLGPKLTGDPSPFDPRSSRITAAPLGTLQGVPYRVVCLLGLDDAALVRGYADGDDLLRTLPLVGDPDARAEQRQAILEAVMAAGERLIVTRTGTDPRTQAEVPAAAPLADLAELLQPVEKEVSEGVNHPRHAIDSSYHLPGASGFPGSVPGGPFGHRAAHARGAYLLHRSTRPPQPPSNPAVRPPAPKEEIPMEDLISFWNNPLDVYVKASLGIDPYEGPPDPEPVIELKATNRDFVHAAETLLEELERVVNLPPFTPFPWTAFDPALSQIEASWRSRLAAEGRIPPGRAGERELGEVTELVRDLLFQAKERDIPLREPSPQPVRIPLPDGRVVVATLPVGPRVSPRSYGRAEMIRHRLETWISALVTGKPVDSRWVFRNPSTPSRREAYPRFARAEAPSAVLLEQLQALVKLRDLAALHPYPRFGKTADELSRGRAKAETALQQHLERLHHDWTSERRLFGPAPRFSDAFPPETLDFYQRLNAFEKHPVQLLSDPAKRRPWRGKS